MRAQNNYSGTTRQIRLYAILTILVWTFLCGILAVWSYRIGQDEIITAAKIMARTSVDKDIAYRHWVAEKGGVYVAIDHDTPPNPYLKVPEREIASPSGRQLTLVNPAYMTRQVFEQGFKLKTSLKSHITSLNPLRPKNMADAWETEAFTHIAQGAEEYGTLWHYEGAPAYRYMRPLMTEKGCLRCHADQGYKEGDVRGGISVIVPLGELMGAQNRQVPHIAMTIGGVWLVGLFGIAFSWRRIFGATTNLQKKRDDMQLLFELTPNGLLLFNKGGEVVMDNAAFRDKYCRAESPHGKRLGDIFTCKNAQEDPRGCAFSSACKLCPICDALQAALDNQLATSDKECRIQTIDQEAPPLTFLFSVTPLEFNSEGGALLVLADITHQKQADHEREKMQALLLQSQKVESIGRLAGGVAHDFNNMLAIISGNVELAMRKLDSDKSIKNHLWQIKETTNRSADLTRQLLGFARRQTIKPQVLDLNNAIEDMLKMLRRLIGEDIELLWKPAPIELKLLIDPSQLDQILTNLVVNARDAISGRGTLALRTELTSFDENYCQRYLWCKIGTHVQLSVSDDGCGMNQDVLEHIFEPFYTTKDVDKGTGLGLATVYGIVKQNNGSINVYSEAGQGTTVRVYFPQSTAQFSKEKSVKEEILAQGTETILLVEDEVSLLEIGQQILNDMGYQVIASSDPLSALQLAADHDRTIDLLLTDVIMPKLNGKELAARFLTVQPEGKVIYMSGYTADIVAARGLLEDGVQLLQKPFTTGTLTKKLREVLDS